MTFINYAAKEINCKIVYYGPGLGGKTTNLQYIYSKDLAGRQGENDLPLRPRPTGRYSSTSYRSTSVPYEASRPVSISTRSPARSSTTPVAS